MGQPKFYVKSFFFKQIIDKMVVVQSLGTKSSQTKIE